jgi:hypothetical protein
MRNHSRNMRLPGPLVTRAASNAARIDDANADSVEQEQFVSDIYSIKRKPAAAPEQSQVGTPIGAAFVFCGGGRSDVHRGSPGNRQWPPAFLTKLSTTFF